MIRETVAKYRSDEGELVEVVSGEFVQKGVLNREDEDSSEKIKFNQRSLKVYRNGETRAIYIHGIDFDKDSESAIRARIHSLEELNACSDEVISGIEHTIAILAEGRETGFRDGDSYTMPEDDDERYRIPDKGFYDGFEEIPMIDKESNE